MPSKVTYRKGRGLACRIMVSTVPENTEARKAAGTQGSPNCLDEVDDSEGNLTGLRSL